MATDRPLPGFEDLNETPPAAGEAEPLVAEQPPPPDETQRYDSGLLEEMMRPSLGENEPRACTGSGIIPLGEYRG